MKLNKLKKIHKELDSLKYKCKENCFECCTAISFLSDEEKLMKKELLKSGYKTYPNGKGNEYCEYLTENGKCSVYNARPVVCRSFGNIAFKLKIQDKVTLTQTCTFAKQILVATPDKDFMDYGFEVVNNGLTNKNCRNIVNNLGFNNVLINDKNNPRGSKETMN